MTRTYQVTMEQFERMQVGKVFRMDGQKVRVVSKDQGNKLSTGWTSSQYFVTVKTLKD